MARMPADPAGPASLGRDEVRMIVLHVLLGGPSHGYAIARAVTTASASALSLGEGTLYPVLRALEHDGLVTAAWRTADGGPARKEYTITPAGRTESQRRLRAWRERYAAIESIVRQQGALGHA